MRLVATTLLLLLAPMLLPATAAAGTETMYAAVVEAERLREPLQAGNLTLTPAGGTYARAGVVVRDAALLPALAPSWAVLSAAADRNALRATMGLSPNASIHRLTPIVVVVEAPDATELVADANGTQTVWEYLDGSVVVRTPPGGDAILVLCAPSICGFLKGEIATVLHFVAASIAYQEGVWAHVAEEADLAWRKPFIEMDDDDAASELMLAGVYKEIARSARSFGRDEIGLSSYDYVLPPPIGEAIARDEAELQARLDEKFVALDVKLDLHEERVLHANAAHQARRASEAAAKSFAIANAQVEAANRQVALALIFGVIGFILSLLTLLVTTVSVLMPARVQRLVDRLIPDRA